MNKQFNELFSEFLDGRSREVIHKILLNTVEKQTREIELLKLKIRELQTKSHKAESKYGV